MKKQTEAELNHRFGKMVKGVHSVLLDKDQLSDTQNMQPGYSWKQRKGMSALTASAVASGLRFKSMVQFRDLKGNTDVVLAHTYDSSGGEDIYQGSALPPNAITWSKKYDLTASCEKAQWANVASALLMANDKDFLIWRGNSHFPTGVWKYNSTAAVNTLFADELFDSDTSTEMPLDGLNVDEYALIVSEMPIDKITTIGGDLNTALSTLAVYVWTGSWEIIEPAWVRSDAALLDDDMSDLSSWVDGDAVNGDSSQTEYNGRETMKLDSGTAAGGTFALRSQDVGSFAAGASVTLRLNHAALGTQGNNDHFNCEIQDGTNKCVFICTTEGLFVYDGASWNEVGTDIVDVGVWTEWTFIVAADFSTVAIYKDGSLQAAAQDCSYAAAGTDGMITLKQNGATTSNRITYVDICKADDGDFTSDSGDSFSDGTATGGASLAQSGDITWTARTDEVKTDVDGVPGYAYKLQWSTVLDNPTSITGLTVHSPMASVKNIWDGMYIHAAGATVDDGTDFTDYTAYVNNLVESQFMDLAGVTTTDKVYVGFNERVNKIIFHMASDGKNTNSATLVAVKYHNASGAATTVGTVTDTTTTNGKVFSQKGYMSWIDPGWQNEKMTVIGGDLEPMYWYEITVSAALVDPTSVYYIQGVPIAKDPDPSRGVFAYKRRAWQIAPRNKENAVRYSGQDLPNVWNGVDSGYVFFGERPLNSAGAFYNESILYADTEMWMLQGNSPTNFGRIRLSSKIGNVSPESLVAIESGVIVQDSLKVVLAWFFYDGIWMFDGVRIWKISAPDIDSFFDPDHDDYINPDYIDQTSGEYDFRTQCVMWNVYSGSAASTPTKTLVMHFPSLNFGIFDYATDIDAMLSVINKRYYTIAGGHSDGRVYQLDSGTTDLLNGTATAVDAYVITKDEFLSYSDGLRQRLSSIWAEAQAAGGQLELDQYPDGSETPQNVAKQSMTVTGKIFGILQRPLKMFSGQKTVKFRIRNRSKNARMNLLGYSTTVDRGRSDE